MRQLRRAATAAGAAAAVLGAVAFFLWIQARDVAQASKDTVGNLVTTIGKDLSERDGVPPELVTTSLQQVDGLVDGLQNRIGDDDVLERARAQMKYHFANAYKRIGGEADPALKTARESLETRIRLSDARADDLDLKSESAEGHELLGDLLRLKRRFDEAQAAFAKARDIWIELAQSPRARAHTEQRERWLVALSKTYSRIGDIHGGRGAEGRSAARDEYARALRVAAYLVADEALSEHTRALADASAAPAALERTAGPASDRRASLWRELSWAYRKLGALDLFQHSVQARALFEQALCLRRAAVERSDQLEWKRDIGYSLRDVGQAYDKAGDAREALIAHAGAYAIRRALQASNERQIDVEFDVAQSLHELGTLFERSRPDERGVALALLDGAVRIRRNLSIRLPGRDQAKTDFETSQKAFRTLCVAMADPGSSVKPEDCRLPERLRGSYEAALDPYEKDADEHRTAAAGCLAPILEGLGDIAGDPNEPWNPPARIAAR